MPLFFERWTQLLYELGVISKLICSRLLEQRMNVSVIKRENWWWGLRTCWYWLWTTGQKAGILMVDSLLAGLTSDKPPGLWGLKLMGLNPLDCQFLGPPAKLLREAGKACCLAARPSCCSLPKWKMGSSRGSPMLQEFQRNPHAPSACHLYVRDLMSYLLVKCIFCLDTIFWPISWCRLLKYAMFRIWVLCGMSTVSEVHISYHRFTYW